MADSSHGRASFWTQADALLRKSFTSQKRDMKGNIRLVLYPLLLCLILLLVQTLINRQYDKPSSNCGCTCIDQNGDGKCEKKICEVEYSTLDQGYTCSMPHPTEWPPLLQIPSPKYRAAKNNIISYDDLPDESCKGSGSCPAIILVTGNNLSLGGSLAGNMLPSYFSMNTSDLLYSLANDALGSQSMPAESNFLDPAFYSNLPLYYVPTLCHSNSSFSISVRIGSKAVQQEVKCVQGLNLWRNSSSEINDELYKGFRKGNSEKKINEIVAAYDFLNSNLNSFNVSIWYNSSYKNESSRPSPPALMRVPRSVNLASNAYLQFLLGPAPKMLFEFTKEMPKPETHTRLDLVSFLGQAFYMLIILQLFPVILISLVYEKQQKLRIMMKMHGLGDGPYLMISYAYFLALSSAYMLCFVIFGSVIGLKFFTLNDYLIQFLFYFIYINLQISLAFLAASVFSDVQTAAVVGYMMILATLFLAAYLFDLLLDDTSFHRGWIIVMELYPGFSLYRGLYEFAEFAFNGNYMGTHGMRWADLSDGKNGIPGVLIIMSVEWFVVIFVAYYIDQVVSSGNGIGRSPLFFLQSFRKKPLSYSFFRKPSLPGQGSRVSVQMEKPDVAQEREKVEQLLLEPTRSHSIICDNLKKVYPRRDGNPEKFAVRGLSLALPQGECFGMLGPNGAGKTSFINMMIGLIKPSSGTAYVQGLDIKAQMNEIYPGMGVCPQHNLLWETLTAREHLLFYGRLKNLKGAALIQAVEESLKSVNLIHGGVADKQVRKYSGGMKRRLSVAISLIGDPKVVYMDEPSTGLDPASRNNLWNVVKCAKQHRAIVLTTHSMEEAEHLCDNLGIFVDGSLQCIGNPKELKARYGGSYVFTMTTLSEHEQEVDNLVKNLSSNANKVYHLSGTQKFELPKHEIKIADVFRAVENAKSRFMVQAWGLVDTTLEDVFIKVAHEAQVSNILA
ncbi:Sulfate-transporting ATPase [Bertholletia excelsa]